MLATLAACPPPNPNDPKAKYATGYTLVKYGKWTLETAHVGFKGFVTSIPLCLQVGCCQLF